MRFRNYTPLIVFAFSKREVEANALSLKNVKLTTSDEEELIETVFNNAMDTLGEDRHLPQSMYRVSSVFIFFSKTLLRPLFRAFCGV